jgi:hypothetical protein
MDEYQIDFAGAQTTRPSTAEVVRDGMTRAVAISVSTKAASCK